MHRSSNDAPSLTRSQFAETRAKRMPCLAQAFAQNGSRNGAYSQSNLAQAQLTALLPSATISDDRTAILNETFDPLNLNLLSIVSARTGCDIFVARAHTPHGMTRLAY
jgi:hypothetical protein